MLSYLMNYGSSIAIDYSKKVPTNVQESELFSLSLQLCTMVQENEGYKLPQFIRNNKCKERFKSLAAAFTYWHNKRMWEWLESNYENIKVASVSHLGIIVDSFESALKERGHKIIDDYIFLKQKEKVVEKIDHKAELKRILEIRQALAAQ